MVWCLKPKKDTSIGPRMRVMERKRTVLEKLRWQESNKPFWKEQCRNYISALVLKTFPQAKRNNFWGCQCLVEDSNSSLRTLKSHHKLYFSLSLCSQPKACPPQKLKPKYSQVLQTHSHGHISLLRTDTSTNTSEHARVALLSPRTHTHHMPFAGQWDKDVTTFMDQQLAVDTLVALLCEPPYPFTALATVRSLQSHNAHYQFQDQSLLQASSSPAARAHPRHLTDVQ